MSGEIEQAVIMVGGRGTRLRPLTETVPKPMLPVMGTPCLEYVIRSLVDSGVKEIVLACGYRSDIISEFIGDGSGFGADIYFAYEEEPAGTAGSIKLLQERLDERFIVASGDVLADVDIQGMVESHEQGGCAVTMALTRVDNPTEFGIVGLDGDGRVERFREKPPPEEVFSDLVNAGIYVLERQVMERVPRGVMYDFSKDLFPDVLSAGLGIKGHILQGFWMDIGRPADLLKANILRAEALGGPGHSHLMDGVELRDVVLTSSVIHPGVKAEGCRIERSVILDNAVVEEGAHVVDCIIGKGATVGRDSRLLGAVIADGGCVPDGHVSDGWA